MITTELYYLSAYLKGLAVFDRCRLGSGRGMLINDDTNGILRQFISLSKKYKWTDGRTDARTDGLASGPIRQFFHTFNYYVDNEILTFCSGCADNGVLSVGYVVYFQLLTDNFRARWLNGRFASMWLIFLLLRGLQNWPGSSLSV